MLLPRARFSSLVLALAAAPLTLAACNRNANQAPANGSTSGAPITVTVRAAKSQDLRDIVTAQGAVAAAQAAIFTVIAPESSKILELPKAEGATVLNGDVLARFDLSALTSELGANPSEVTAANMKLEAAKADFARQDDLFAKGYVSKNSYDASKAALASAQAAVKQLQAQTTATSALNDRAIVRAPFDGIVTHVYKAVGDVADLTSNAAVLQLVDPTRVQVSAQVSPSQALRLAPGQAATVSVTSSGESQPATVILVPQLTGTDGPPTVEVRLSLTASTPPPLATPVAVEIVVDQRNHVVVVPDSAVQKDETSSYVMIAGADGRAHRRDVRVGLTVSHFAEIQSGVTDGDEVIVGGLDQVADGYAIQIDRNR
jgi:RND family efflux transporter MFP subunit